jgi:hypothetical protein
MIVLYSIVFYRLKMREKARCLRHSTPVNKQIENENISVALFSGAQIAQNVGKYLKRQADQLFFEYSYPVITLLTPLKYSTSHYLDLNLSNNECIFIAGDASWP